MFTKDVLSKGGRGLKKRTALPFPILFVKDFGNLKGKGGMGVKKSLFLEDVLCEWSLTPPTCLQPPGFSEMGRAGTPSVRVFM